MCLFRYSVAASLVHPDNYCITVSFACLYILHLLLSAGKALFAFHVLVSTICSCTTITDATFFVSILHCSHLLLSSYSFSYTSPYIFTFLCSSLIYNFMTFPSVTILVSSHFTIFPLNLSYYTFFAIIKLFSLLRLLFAFFLSSSIIRFSLRVVFLQCFLRYISFPALATSCLSSFTRFFIFLTLLFSFAFFSFLSGLLISSLISTVLTIAYTASVISGKEFLSTYISHSLSSISSFVDVITLSICAWNSSLRFSSSSFTSISSRDVCSFSSIIS